MIIFCFLFSFARVSGVQLQLIFLFLRSLMSYKDGIFVLSVFSLDKFRLYHLEAIDAFSYFL